MLLQLLLDVCLGDEAKHKVGDRFDSVLDIEGLIAAGQLLDVGFVDRHLNELVFELKVGMLLVVAGKRYLRPLPLVVPLHYLFLLQ